MRASLFRLLVPSSLALLVAGCGGGQSLAPSGPVGGSSTTQLGEFAVQSSGNAKPEVAVMGSTVVTGISGESISLMRLIAGQDLNETRIIFDQTGVAYTVRPNGTDQTMVTMNLPSSPGTGLHSCMNASGVIAFECQGSDGCYHITLCNPDGSGQHAVTSGSFQDVFPNWSADGSKIVFSRINPVTNLSTIEEMNADGSGMTARSDGSHTDVVPCFAPDGVRIAFSRLTVQSPTTYQIYVSTAGTTTAPLANDNPAQSEIFPSWSPDGSKIACTTQTFSGSTITATFLSVLGANGVGNVQITSGTTDSDLEPTFSPDDRQLAWTRVDSTGNNANIFVGDAAGNGAQPVSTTFTPGGQPNWSPFPHRLYIGPSGILGTNADGVLFSQSGEGAETALAFSATTPGTASAKKDPNVDPGSEAIVFDLSADHITSLKYVDDLYGMPVTVLPGGGFTSAIGAIVSYSSATGKIESVLPFVSPSKRPGGAVSHRQGSALVYEGNFIGVYDGKGKNHAPSGAKKVTLDAKTGSLKSVQ